MKDTLQSINIKGLANIELLKKFQNLFFRLTGLYTTFIDNNADFITQARGQCKFCKIISLEEKRTGISRCWESNRNACIKAQKLKKPYIYKCYAGLTEVIVPIIVEDNVIGTVLTGQIRAKGQSIMPANLFKNKHLLNKLKKSYTDISVVTPQQIESASQLLSLMINYIFKMEFDFLVLSEIDKHYTYTREIINKAIEHVKNNYNCNISLKEISEVVGLSPFYFEHVFSKAMKCSFTKYLNKIRMAAAVKLLKDPRNSVKQVSYKIGYTDQYYFSKVFKKIYKLSPANFREKYL